MKVGDRVVVIAPNGYRDQHGTVVGCVLSFGRDEISVDLDSGKVRKFWLGELMPEGGK